MFLPRRLLDVQIAIGACRCVCFLAWRNVFPPFELAVQAWHGVYVYTAPAHCGGGKERISKFQVLGQLGGSDRTAGPQGRGSAVVIWSYTVLQ